MIPPWCEKCGSKKPVIAIAMTDVEGNATLTCLCAACGPLLEEQLRLDDIEGADLWKSVDLTLRCEQCGGSGAGVMKVAFACGDTEALVVCREHRDLMAGGIDYLTDQDGHRALTVDYEPLLGVR